MRRVIKDESALLRQIRIDAYKLFLSGEGNGGVSFDRGNPKECRSAALMIALNGDFPRAFELFNCYPPKKQKNFLLRLIAATRKALMPHEAEQSRHLDDFDFLLWREYFDAARWLIRRSGTERRADYSIRVYEKTGLPTDLAAARSAVRKRVEYGNLLYFAERLAQLTRQDEDVAFFRDLVGSDLPDHAEEKIGWLLKVYGCSKTAADLEAAISVGEKLNNEATADWRIQVERLVSQWKMVALVTRCKRVRKGLARARELLLAEKQKRKEAARKHSEEVFASPADCIRLVGNDWLIDRDDEVSDAAYLGRALELIGSLSGSERLKLLVSLTDTIDSISDMRK